ncbi:MAG TPA: hypothetical protein VF110_02310 [Burkholderiales bacterium]
MNARAAIVAALLCIPYPAAAQDQWRFSVMPYLWFPSLDGTLRYSTPVAGGAIANVSVDADTLLGALDAAFMIAGEARKGRWSIAADLIYLDLAADQSALASVDFNTGSGPVNVATSALDAGTQTTIKGRVAALVGGYALVREPQPTLDLIAGVRYLSLEAKTDWRLSATVTGPGGGTQTFAPGGTLTRSDDLWDAVVGVKGRITVGDSRWFAPYYLDVGGGDSSFTWQGMFGAGYAFKWGDALLAYRYLYYYQSGSKLIDELSFGGLAVGLNFRF